MGNAKARGSYQERKAQAIKAGRTPENRLVELPRKQRRIVRETKTANDVVWPDGYQSARIKQHAREQKTATKKQAHKARMAAQEAAKKAKQSSAA